MACRWLGNGRRNAIRHWSVSEQPARYVLIIEKACWSRPHATLEQAIRVAFYPLGQVELHQLTRPYVYYPAPTARQFNLAASYQRPWREDQRPVVVWTGAVTTLRRLLAYLATAYVQPGLY